MSGEFVLSQEAQERIARLKEFKSALQSPESMDLIDNLIDEVITMEMEKQ